MIECFRQLAATANSSAASHDGRLHAADLADLVGVALRQRLEPTAAIISSILYFITLRGAQKRYHVAADFLPNFRKRFLVTTAQEDLLGFVRFDENNHFCRKTSVFVRFPVLRIAQCFLFCNTIFYFFLKNLQ